MVTIWRPGFVHPCSNHVDAEHKHIAVPYFDQIFLKEYFIVKVRNAVSPCD